MSTFRFSIVRSILLILLPILMGCAQELPDQARVVRIIDGDTVQLSNGRLVRYLGIDTPEVRRRQGDQWIEDPEPWGPEATQANHGYVHNRRVRLEYDVRTHDRFGRLLAYVYVEEIMVNAELLKAGLARPMNIAPNARYAQLFESLAQQAREQELGLWRR